MTLWCWSRRVVLELDVPEVELVLEQSADGCWRAAWVDSQTGRRWRVPLASA